MFYINLILQESSWYRSCLHKGLLANISFFLVMVLGVVLGEVLFPLEGLRGRNTSLNNDTTCTEEFEGSSWYRDNSAIDFNCSAHCRLYHS
jgi:hypothetical protein